MCLGDNHDLIMRSLVTYYRQQIRLYNINLTFLYALPNPVMTTQHTLSLNRHTLESKHVIQYESCYIDATYKKDCNKGLS